MSESPEGPTGARIAAGPVRRLRLIACGALLAVLAAMGLSYAPWWHFSLDAVVVDGAMNRVPVHASATASPRDVLAAGPAAQVVGLPAAQQVPRPPAFAGHPQAVVLLAAALGIGLVAYAFRTAVLWFVATAAVPLAWSAHQALCRMVENPATGGGYLRSLWAKDAFETALLATGAFMFTAAVQQTVISVRARAAARATGARSPSLFDAVFAAVRTQMTRLETPSSVD